MKKIFVLLSTFIIASSVNAQSKFTGYWKGTLNIGQEIDIVYTIQEKDGELSASLDIPAQGAKGIQCSGVITDGNNITIEMKMVNGSYEGLLVGSDNIEGKWNQNGMNLPLKLERFDGDLELVRPQTPKPPYSYNSEDVIYYNKDKSIQYGATITTPKDGKQHPAVILISGSGQQNRDSELFGHKPFAVLADHLTKNGYVVLRVDDRGIGETTGDLKNATSADFATDVLNGVTYLKTRKEVETEKIGLLGHSEGGVIAPLAANQSDDIDFIILAAAPGVQVVQLMTEQNVATLQKAGLNEGTANAYGVLYNGIMYQLAEAESKEIAEQKINEVIDNWKLHTDKQVVAFTTGITDEASQEKFAAEFIKLYDNAWMQYFISYDPLPVLKNLDCKVLALNGTNDIQVLSKSNLEGIEFALKQSNATTYKIVEVDGANHLFQNCDKCTVAEYGQLEQTIMPEVLDIITNWLNENVK